MQTNYLTTLTPLRGIAAILVVVFHSNLMLGAFIPTGYTHLVDAGWLWVDFFFVLSGFILAYVYTKDFSQSVKRSAYWKYMGSRFARVYPLHFFTLIICAGLAMIIRSKADGLDPFFADFFNPGAVPASMAFIQTMHLYITAPLNSPSWSLSTEWWMYMVFPLFVPIFTQLKGTGRLIATASIITLYVVLMYYIGPLSGLSKPSINLISDFAILRCAAGFLLGMLLHQFYVHHLAYSLFKSDFTFILLFVGVLVAMHFQIHALLIIGLFPLVLLAAAYNEGIVKKILDTKPLQRLGDWSFSIYMVHVPIMYGFWIYLVHHDPKLFSDFMTLVMRPPNYLIGLTYFIILLPTTLIVAGFTYNYIEIPSRNYFNKLFRTKTMITSITPSAING